MRKTSLGNYFPIESPIIPSSTNSNNCNSSTETSPNNQSCNGNSISDDGTPSPASMESFGTMASKKPLLMLNPQHQTTKDEVRCNLRIEIGNMAKDRMVYIISPKGEKKKPMDMAQTKNGCNMAQHLRKLEEQQNIQLTCTDQVYPTSFALWTPLMSTNYRIQQETFGRRVQHEFYDSLTLPWIPMATSCTLPGLYNPAA